MKVEPAAIPPKEIHDFFSSLVTPRPIAFISTVNAKGQYNAAPFSSFIRLTLNPAIVIVGIGRRKGQKKDTVNNIEAVGDFVINMVDENLAEAMNKCATEWPPEVDEIKETGLTPMKSDKVKSPRIAEAPISLECKLMQIVEFGNSPGRSTIILGEVVMLHVKDEIMTAGKIDPRKAKIVGRLGDGNIYCRTTDVFHLQRP
ncbi:MAG: flavin reductase family protein [Chloroflexi bacterium]|nr:flavin reductase family protein [Chloroflexota bacterium]